MSLGYSNLYNRCYSGDMPPPPPNTPWQSMRSTERMRREVGKARGLLLYWDRCCVKWSVRLATASFKSPSNTYILYIEVQTTGIRPAQRVCYVCIVGLPLLAMCTCVILRQATRAGKGR